MPTHRSGMIAATLALTCVMLCLTPGAVNAADYGWFGRWRDAQCRPNPCPASAYCPDDYCRKPFPAAPCPNQRCAPECFVRKPFPCERCVTGSVTCDDYTIKCLPQEPCPFRPCASTVDAYLTTPWYRYTSAPQLREVWALKR